jgi:hypothetical protein
MVARHLIGKKFEGDEAVKPDVLGLVDDAHAARAEPFKNTVVRNCLADQGAAGCVPLTLYAAPSSSSRVAESERYASRCGKKLRRNYARATLRITVKESDRLENEKRAT